MSWRLLCGLVVAAVSAYAGTAAADFALDPVFGDHMVLQRNRPLRFSGSAAACQTVEVRLVELNLAAKAVADAGGRWSVELPARAEGGPYSVEVRTVALSGNGAASSVRLSDVMIGEVWLASGQSNMEYWVLGENLEEPPFYHLTNGNEVAATKDPGLRLLYVPKGVAPDGLRRWPSAPMAWKRAETREANGRMSAVAFLFGRELRRRLGATVPVGILSAAWGGSEIEPWISEAQLTKSRNDLALERLSAARLDGDVLLRREVERKAIFRKRTADLRAWTRRLRETGRKPDGTMSDYAGPGVTRLRFEPEVPSDWAGHPVTVHFDSLCDVDQTLFDGEEIGRTGVETPKYWEIARDYRIPSVRSGRHVLDVEIEHHCGRALVGKRAWLRDETTGRKIDLWTSKNSRAVVLVGNPVELGPRPKDPFGGCQDDPRTGMQTPATLFNAMIVPLTGLNIGGVIWYQGCANAQDVRRYPSLQRDLIDSWREAFRQDRLPFVSTQVSAYERHSPENRLPDDYWLSQTAPFEHVGFGRLRLAQDSLRDYPRTGIACTVDIGDPSDIHPPNKQEVARRLAHEAMRIAFGDRGALPAPRGKTARLERDGSVTVDFSDCGDGLSLDGGKVTFHPHLFALAEADGVYRWAEGALRADGTVAVRASSVRKPRWIQYCVSACPPGVCFRRKDDGLPVMPFEMEVREPGVIYPGAIWRDTAGEPIQAHGGSIIVSEGKYWWYGEDKTGIDGRSSRWHAGVRAYTSTNLVDWTDEGTIIAYEPEKLMDRPHILYNAKTRKYVAWLKVMGKDVQTRTILAADRMKGPWSMVKESFLPGGLSCGDFDLAQDDDGRAYAYFERPHTELVSAELTDDYLDIRPETVHVDFPNRKPPYTREAPAHFIWNGRHWLFTSGTTGYYPNPSEIAESSDWLGPWKKRGDAHAGDATRTSFHSQISSVFKVPGKDLYIALADRWLPDQMDIGYGMVENAFRKWFGHGGYDEKLYDEFMALRSGRTDETGWARYVWLPVVFRDGIPTLEWRDSWKPEVK